MHLHWKERTGEGEDTGEREDAVKQQGPEQRLFVLRFRQRVMVPLR